MRIRIQPDNAVIIVLAAVITALTMSIVLFADEGAAGAQGCGRFISFPIPEASGSHVKEDGAVSSLK